MELCGISHFSQELYLMNISMDRILFILIYRAGESGKWEEILCEIRQYISGLFGLVISADLSTLSCLVVMDHLNTMPKLMVWDFTGKGEGRC